jgi:gliding motility-associated-like protein
VGINTTTALTVTLGNSPAFPVVGYSIPSNVVIQAGQNSATFVVNTAQDGNVGNNVFSITGAVGVPVPNYVVVSGTLTVSDITAGGMNGTGSTTLTISSGTVSETLSKTLSVSLPVGINTTTALTVALGYSPAFPVVGYSIPANVVIQAGQNSATFVVNTAQDGNVGNNVFSITGTVSVPNYVVTTGILTVSDITAGGMNGTGSMTLTIGSGTVSETLSKTLSVGLPVGINTTTALTVTLGNSPAFPVVGYSIPSNVVIQAGQNSATFVVNTAQDNNVGNNVFSITGIVSIPNYVIMAGTLTVSDITAGGMNGTGSTTLTISSGTVPEGGSRALNVSLPITINVTNTPLTLTINTDIPFFGGYFINSSSVSGSVSFTLVIPAGQHQANYTLQTALDGNIPDNIFHLSGSSLSSYTFVSGTVTVTNSDARRSPVLTITSSSTTVVGGTLTASVTTTATVSSGGTLTYRIVGTGAGSATIDSATGFITAYKAGTVVLIASTAGDTNYGAVTTSQVLTIGRGTPTLSLTSTTQQMNVDGTLSVFARSYPALAGGITSVGALQYSIVSGSATINQNGLVTAVAVGSVVVQVSQSADANYNSPVPATLTLTVNPSSQTLTISSINIMSVGGSITPVVHTSATGGRGGTLIYAITNVSPGTASINPFTHVITGTAGGTVVLTVSTLGDANYMATSTSQTITIVTLLMSSTSNTLKEGESGTMLLSLDPAGISLPVGVTFNVSGGVASSSHYRVPSTIVFSGGQTSTLITIQALSDSILYNDELLTVVCTNVYLGSVSSSISITDATSLDPQNRVITISNGTIFQEETKQIKASLPAGITTARAIVVTLSIDPSSDFGLLSGPPVVESSVTIPVNGNSGLFTVSAASANVPSAKVILDGSSSSFTIEQGVVTVLNKKLDIVLAVSSNGDGVDDCLTISNIEKYPQNTVSIFDRHGILVYQVDGYDNGVTSFCGSSNQGHVYDLPGGTYYYVIRFTDKTKDKNNTTEELFNGYFEKR